MKTKKIIYWIIGLVICFFVVKAIVQIIISFNESDFYSEDLKKEYMNLFSENNQDSLSVVWNYNSKVRNQISLFDYGNQKKYCITVYKIPIAKDFSLNEINIEKAHKETLSAGNIYTTINEGLLFELNYVSGSPPQAKSINFSYSGDSLEDIVENDSIKYYSLNAESFSIRYNKENVVDIFGKAEDFWNKRLALNVLFLKRNNSLYLLLMTVNHNTDILPSDLLYNLIVGTKMVKGIYM